MDTSPSDNFTVPPRFGPFRRDGEPIGQDVAAGVTSYLCRDDQGATRLLKVFRPPAAGPPPGARDPTTDFLAAVELQKRVAEQAESGGHWVAVHERGRLTAQGVPRGSGEAGEVGDAAFALLDHVRESARDWAARRQNPDRSTPPADAGTGGARTSSAEAEPVSATEGSVPDESRAAEAAKVQKVKAALEELKESANTQTLLTSADVYAVISGVLAGLGELRKATGRCHGNLRLETVRLAGPAAGGRAKRLAGRSPSPVRLTDPSPTAGGDDAAERADLLAIGTLLFKLVLGPRAELKIQDRAFLERSDRADWKIVGREWLNICVALLAGDRAPNLGMDALAERVRRARPGQAVARALSAVAATAAVLVVVALAASWWLRHPAVDDKREVVVVTDPVAAALAKAAAFEADGRYDDAVAVLRDPPTVAAAGPRAKELADRAAEVEFAKDVSLVIASISGPDPSPQDLAAARGKADRAIKPRPGHPKALELVKLVDTRCEALLKRLRDDVGTRDARKLKAAKDVLRALDGQAPPCPGSPALAGDIERVVGEWVAQGRRMDRARQFEAALRNYQQAMAVSPERSELSGLIAAAQDRGKKDEAHRAAVERADAAVVANSWREAVGLYDAAVKADPGNEYAAGERARLLGRIGQLERDAESRLAAGQYDAAAAVADSLLARDADNPRAKAVRKAVAEWRAAVPGR